MSKKFFLTMLLLAGLFSAVMFFFPQIDLTVSSWFYKPSQGFLLENTYEKLHLAVFRDGMVYLTYLMIIGLVLMLLFGIFSKKYSTFLSTKICLFLLLSFAVAPAFVVNDLLKNHWGRARPFQVKEFGGDKAFTRAWEISNQCEKNCSFTSGETANVFCYLALLFILKRKKLAATLIFTLGFLMIFERIAQGDHFLSDSILSGFIDYLLIWLIYQAMQQFPQKEWYLRDGNDASPSVQ
jgi:lipid A 4'-phosphatase